MLFQIVCSGIDPVPKGDGGTGVSHLSPQHHQVLRRRLRGAKAGLHDVVLGKAEQRQAADQCQSKHNGAHPGKFREYPAHQGHQGIEQNHADDTQAHQGGEAVAPQYVFAHITQGGEGNAGTHPNEGVGLLHAAFGPPVLAVFLHLAADDAGLQCFFLCDGFPHGRTFFPVISPSGPWRQRLLPRRSWRAVSGRHRAPGGTDGCTG